MTEQALIDHLAALSRLSFEGEEKERMAKDMESIMKLMDTITEVEISEADYPLTAEGGMELLREDEIQPSMPVGDVIENAKGKLYHFIAVPKLID
ncbi:MAG: Asp-tRNA(Asn)/Glu-tRNA(Gln) amidotransferase subunit GatC [Clostridia bacterium]|nr:Asp-tRNA(Asn)/Glu-tRNA(Gln) amidotransferase subunit GatC [Clostridia bacterium]